MCAGQQNGDESREGESRRKGKPSLENLPARGRGEPGTRMSRIARGDASGEKQSKRKRAARILPHLFSVPVPKNKSFRKGDGGAGEGGQPFFKRVSLFPRHLFHFPFFLCVSAGEFPKPEFQRAAKKKS